MSMTYRGNKDNEAKKRTIQRVNRKNKFLK